MKVLSLGTDESVFDGSSAVRQRQRAYAEALGQLELVVLTKEPHALSQDGALTLRAVAGNRFARLWHAYRVMVASEKPDVVTVQDPFDVGFVGWLVARHFGVPLHVQVHTDFLSPAFAKRSFVNGIRTRLAPFVLKRASRIRVVSERIERSITPRFNLGGPVSVLPIFVDTGTFKDAIASDELVARFSKFARKLLVVSRLEPEKKVELAIRAFADAVPEDTCLIVVGDGSERERLEWLSRSLHVEQRVFFEGVKQPAPYYAIADLVLVASTYEGYGLVIIEALAAGKPVLSTDVGIAREAGAIVSDERHFASDLRDWFQKGPRAGALRGYPYEDFGEYVRAYCADIEACLPGR